MWPPEDGAGLSDRDREIIAAACHAAWYAFAVLALGEQGAEWEQAPEWQRESIRGAVGFWLAHEGHSDLERLSHENWSRQRVSAGWTYGLVRNPVAKTSPCLVPYEDLPAPQRTKDRVVVQAFRATVLACRTSGTGS